ncbi:EF-hand domain-containing protein [Allonocardiopsis opalescens]|uniref:EF hand domain-containing protein n=1 Tax=Allonocardiopsis opalescens TaxID=1144618 RepID=A0A2T0Q5P3_9ACTN|nr:EF-hand domain-containing protein [Allonocardiopsis opalescens]PRX99031.1 EF hand domain-containing protein [Allonocardiopsis opalescens]
MTTAYADAVGDTLGRLFDVIDSDHDHRVEWADYQRLVDRYLTGYALAPDSRKAVALRTAYRMAWTELLRHAGGPEPRLDRAEFIAALRTAVVDTSRFNLVEGLAHAVFDVLDADGGNTIGREEVIQLMDVLGVTTTDGLQVFSAMDADGDGNVSRQEFIRSAREFFYRADPRAPGGIIFGMV